MTSKEIRTRNNNIRMFRGASNRIIDIIPDDILEGLDSGERHRLKRIKKTFSKVIEIMNDVAGCTHLYNDNNKCEFCGHVKFKHDGLGKTKFINKVGIDSLKTNPTPFEI